MTFTKYVYFKPYSCFKVSIGLGSYVSFMHISHRLSTKKSLFHVKLVPYETNKSP